MLRRFKEEPQSMLARYLGLYKMDLDNKSWLFVVMRAVGGGGNHKIHKTYDLKGSLRNRRAPSHDSVGKDLNFLEELGDLGVDSSTAARFLVIHQDDVTLLKRYGIMDYSLLLRIHSSEHCEKEHSGGCSANRVGLVSGGTPGRTLVAANARRLEKRLELDQAQPMPIGIPSSSKKLTYFFGLIDILVPFTAYPLLQYCGTHLITCGGGDSCSRVPPELYGSRQHEFVASICGSEGPRRKSGTLAPVLVPLTFLTCVGALYLCQKLRHR
jgi:hypothetical protein